MKPVPRVLPLALVVLGLLSLPSAGQAASAAPAPQRWVMGYYVGYLRDRLPLSAVNWSALTHIVVGAATPNSDGTVNDSFDLDPLQGPGWAKSVVMQAHAHGVKALLMLGGDGQQEHFRQAASGPLRSKLVEDLLRVVRQGGFDGIDLDWEPLEASDVAPLKALAEALRAARPGLTLTLPVGWANSNFPQDTPPFYGPLSTSFDRVNIMTYAMNAAEEGWAAWHSSALSGETERTPSSVRANVRAYLKAGVPAAKLGVGIGFFGSCLRGATAPGQTSGHLQVVADDNVISYAAIVRQYLPQMTVHWDAAAQVPYLASAAGVGPQRCQFISYENPRSIALKAADVKRLGLGGVIIWNINQGYIPDAPVGQRDPLMQAIKEQFRR